MFESWIVFTLVLIYLGLTFIIAYVADQSSKKGKSLISNPYIYALTFSIYATDWTFYGSVGTASKNFMSFLPVYLGPTIIAPLMWYIVRKEIRICKDNLITSLADFVAFRYRKSAFVGTMVTIMLIVGTLPYISLQLKGIATTFDLLTGNYNHTDWGMDPILQDTAFYIAILMSIFTIIFGTRSLDASEKHEGMVAVVAFESITKLAAFLAVGLFIVFGMFSGPFDLFDKAAKSPIIQKILLENTKPGFDYSFTIFLSMFAIMFLPHMFQVSVLENTKEEFIEKVVWLFPIYLVAMNIFVIPITMGGLLTYDAMSKVNPDTYVLNLPITTGNSLLSLFVFIGGFSAGISMGTVAVLSLSAMISNNLIVPILLKTVFTRVNASRDLSKYILLVRRISIFVLLIMSYLFFKYISRYTGLVSIGMISFAATAQLVPSIIGGLYWKKGNIYGAVAGMVAGFAIWAYTLPFPMIIEAGFLPKSILEVGPFGISFFNPIKLFGQDSLGRIAHSVFWSIPLNLFLYIAVSVFTKTSDLDHNQAEMFVNALSDKKSLKMRATKLTADIKDLEGMMNRFLGVEHTKELLEDYAIQKNINREELNSDKSLIDFVEINLSTAIGVASARAMIHSVVDEEPLSMDEVMNILDESQQIKKYSLELELKSRQLEAATNELKKILREVEEIKLQQDGDYYLTSLLLKPFFRNDLRSDNLSANFIIKQKKHFEFKKWSSEIGGDLCTVTAITLNDRRYAIFINADAMGKSMQGAGGAIVIGSVFHAIIARTLVNTDLQHTTPEAWLKESFQEMQMVFESFNGSMVVSAVFGLVDEENGLVYYINAEHPWMVLYREGKASFVQGTNFIRKIGIPLFETSVEVETFHMNDGDVIIAGSDGRDDISFGISEIGHRIINEDETLFLKHVEQGLGDLDKIQEIIKGTGELTDDISLLSISFQKNTVSITTKVPSMQETIVQARVAKMAGKDQEALNLLLSEYAKNSKSEEILKELIYLYHQRSEFDKAISFGENYIKINPNNEKILLLLSHCYKKMKNYQKSIQIGEQVIQIDPDLVINYHNLINTLIATKNLKKAAHYTNIALKKDPENKISIKLKEMIDKNIELRKSMQTVQ